MKVKERAIADLEAALTLKPRNPDFFTSDDNRIRNMWIAVEMRKRGWTTITSVNLTETAESLGFTVIGDFICNFDD